MGLRGFSFHVIFVLLIQSFLFLSRFIKHLLFQIVVDLALLEDIQYRLFGSRGLPVFFVLLAREFSGSAPVLLVFRQLLLLYVIEIVFGLVRLLRVGVLCAICDEIIGSHRFENDRRVRLP